MVESNPVNKEKINISNDQEIILTRSDLMFFSVRQQRRNLTRQLRWKNKQFGLDSDVEAHEKC